MIWGQYNKLIQSFQNVSKIVFLKGKPKQDLISQAVPPSQPSQRGNLACHSTTPMAGNLQSRSCHLFTNSTELLPFPSHIFMGASLIAQLVNHLPAMQKTRVRLLGQEDPLEKEMATHSTTLAWRILWTEELDRLQSMGSQESDRTQRLNHHHQNIYSCWLLWQRSYLTTCIITQELVSVSSHIVKLAHISLL